MLILSFFSSHDRLRTSIPSSRRGYSREQRYHAGRPFLSPYLSRQGVSLQACTAFLEKICRSVRLLPTEIEACQPSSYFLDIADGGGSVFVADQEALLFCVGNCSDNGRGVAYFQRNQGTRFPCAVQIQAGLFLPPPVLVRRS